MFCMYCGKEIPDGSRFCLYCGRSFEEMSDHQSQDAVREEMTSFSPAEQELNEQPAPAEATETTSIQSDDYEDIFPGEMIWFSRQAMAVRPKRKKRA